jgi:3'5'-cyclic nucleotide phosphodiesterase
MKVDEGTLSSSIRDERRTHAAVALEITAQDWEVLGLSDGQYPNVEASSSLSVTADRITSVLVTRLVALAAPSHQFSDLSTTTICKRILRTHRINSVWPEAVTQTIVAELRTFVEVILKGYNLVPYHNFEHCYHVLISANKLLDLILTSRSLEEQTSSDCNLRFEEDPLMHLSLLWAALIHDVEHQGVPNAQLMNENSPLAIQYSDQSIAEQRSLFIGFNELLKPAYENLRNVMFPFTFAGDGYRRFRLAITNLVLATDISSPERSDIVRKKWKEAFEIDSHVTKPRVIPDTNRRRTRPGSSAIAPPPEHPTPNRRRKTLENAKVMKQIEKAREEKQAVKAWVDLGVTPSTHFPKCTSHSADESLIFWWFTPHDESDENGESTDTGSFSEETTAEFLSASVDFASFLSGDDAETRCAASKSDLDASISILQDSTDSVTASFSDSYYPHQSNEFQFSCSSTMDDSTEFQHLLSPSRLTRHGRFNRSCSGTSDSKRHESSTYSDLSVVSGSDSFLSPGTKGVFGAFSFGSKKKGRKQRHREETIDIDVPEMDSLDLTSTDVSSTCTLSCASRAPADDDQIIVRKEPHKERAIKENTADTRDEQLCTMSLLEHILLVSDVAHTMQGWNVMNKFALRLSKEIQASIDAGRSGSIIADPLSDWYSNQSGFLVGYIKPLAERMEKTGFIPVSADRQEPLLTTLVQANLERWQEEGHDVVSAWRREREKAKRNDSKEKPRKAKSSPSPSRAEKYPDDFSSKKKIDRFVKPSRSEHLSSSFRPPNKHGSLTRVRRTKSECSLPTPSWRNPIDSPLETPVESPQEEEGLHRSECETEKNSLKPFTRPIPRTPTG